MASSSVPRPVGANEGNRSGLHRRESLSVNACRMSRWWTSNLGTAATHVSVVVLEARAISVNQT